MADALYLSLWYPNLRVAALADKLVAVLGAFAAHGGEARVYAVTVWPVSWSETPVFQRVYGHGERGAEPAGRLLRKHSNCSTTTMPTSFRSAGDLWEFEAAQQGLERSLGAYARGWSALRALVRSSMRAHTSRTGHVRIDFGSDAAFLEEDADLDAVGSAPRGRKCAPTGRTDGCGGERVRRNGAPAVERDGREPGTAAGGLGSAWGN